MLSVDKLIKFDAKDKKEVERKESEKNLGMTPVASFAWWSCLER
jgi:hypothetical protein